MRAIILFAPGFMAFGKAFMKELQKRNSAIEIIGLAATRKTFAALQKDKSCEFMLLDCLEDREREWLRTHYDPQELKLYEDMLGTKVVGNIMIVDRLVSAGLISCALPIETELTRRCRDHNVMRAYMTGMLRYVNNLCDEHNPDAAFLYAIAGGPASALAWVMHARDLAVLKLQHTRVEDRFMIDTSMTGLLDPVWDRFFNNEQGRRECRDRAEAWIDEFRTQDKKPDYFVYNTARLKKLFSPWNITKNAASAFGRWVYYLFFPSHKQLRAEDGFFRVVEAFMVPLRSRKMARESSYDDYETLKGGDFIYFTLHVDPEASTMHLAPDFTDQVGVIESLAKRRPLHMNILVKEHPNMIGRRPPEFYERIRRLPGVYLISPSVPSSDLIRRSKLVFTITGTAAWEALAMRKPAAVLGHLPFLPFATRLGRGIKLAKMDTLADDILEALQVEPVSDEELTRFLSLLYEESFSLSSQLFWGMASDNAIKRNIVMVEAMAEQFLARYSDYRALASAA